MNPPNRLPAGVLATVLVVSALMLLSVLGVLALWESGFSVPSPARATSRGNGANVESAFVLDAADSTLTARLDEQGGLRLYDGLPDSRVRIAVRPWGLYEAVRVEAADPPNRSDPGCSGRPPPSHVRRAKKAVSGMRLMPLRCRLRDAPRCTDA